jgi:hypothetical protein
MPLTPLLFSLLLAAQAPVPADQVALAACLGRFAEAQLQAGAPAAEFVDALANACQQEERAYRSAFLAATTARGAAYLDAESEAYRNVQHLRIAQRGAYLAATGTCARQPARRR